MINYAFGAGGFKLGEKVKIITTGQKGVLINEVIHISGCNTYQILLPNVLVDGKMKTTHRDYLMLKRLDPNESLFDETKELTDENSFSQISVGTDAERIRAAINEQKEFIPEVDDAAGVEEIAFRPGMEVWNKVYGKTMIVNLISREIYAKEIMYGAVYMIGDKEEMTFSNAYTFVPLEQKLNVPSAEKTGPLFDDGRYNIENDSRRQLQNQ